MFKHCLLMQITVEEEMEYREQVKKKGWLNFLRKETKKMNKWRDIKIKIAICGEAGAGKSTLINSIRGLRADDDGAAKDGLVETTSERTMYSLPGNSNIELWDLPGFGTSKFKDKDEYMKTVNWHEFETILLISAKRFTENDAWLARKILNSYPEQNLFFVRTQVDLDILNFKKSRRIRPSRNDIEHQLKIIREDSSEQLNKNGITQFTVFLIDSLDQDAFDFPNLVQNMLAKANGLKKEAIVLSLSGFSKCIIDPKLRQLRNGINKYAIFSAIAAMFGNISKNTIPEVEVMFRYARFCREQLGLNDQNLENLTKHLNKELKTMLNIDNMESSLHCTSLEMFASFYMQQKKYVHGRFSFSSFREIIHYHKICQLTLNAYLDICARDLKTIQSSIQQSLREN